MVARWQRTRSSGRSRAGAFRAPRPIAVYSIARTSDELPRGWGWLQGASIRTHHQRRPTLHALEALRDRPVASQKLLTTQRKATADNADTQPTTKMTAVAGCTAATVMREACCFGRRHEASSTTAPRGKDRRKPRQNTRQASGNGGCTAGSAHTSWCDNSSRSPAP